MNSIEYYQPEIRFADIDAMGHINNAVYFSYFEQARIHFFSHLLNTEWNWEKRGVLVAHNEIDYLQPVFLHDSIFIVIQCTHLGTKSFTLSYEVKKKSRKEDELCARGSSVLVCFNHETKQTVPVPEEWKNALTVRPVTG
ncbi:MAG: acyl-CoA thioesterase [Crocinitomicaceae bacterium]|nr:acyl-CoA thioesterase [Crocinitomicaceae bacterium]